MSRYKEHREPRRRGYDDDNYRPEPRSAGAPPPSRRPSFPQDAGGDAVEATVKWFNAEKGFGFVALAGGSEAFLHIRPLEAAGHSSLPEGARIKVRVGQGQKGPQVTEVLEVDTTAAAGFVPSERPARPPVSRREPTGATEERVGTVKFYNTDKGFGFIGLEDGDKDVFIHATTIARSGMTGLTEGQRVQVQVGQGQKGPEARSIKLLP